MRRLTRLVTLITFAALLAAGCGAERDDSGAIVEEGDVGLFDARTGDCLNVPDGDQVVGFEGIPCDQPHDAQVFAAFDLDGSDYPGDNDVSEVSELGCIDRFEGFIGIDYMESQYYLTTIYPTEDTWNQQDDREVLCLAVPGPEGGQLTQDLQNIAQ